MEIGDVVRSRKYPEDLLFYIYGIKDDGTYMLKGINYRLNTVQKEDELEPVSRSALKIFKHLFKEDVEKKIQDIFKRRSDELNNEKYDILSGKILHIDADEDYLRMCMSFYKRLKLTAVGEKAEEEKQPFSIRYFLEKHRPDILVITGHDSLKKADNAEDIDSYRSSAFFVEAVKSARAINPDKDSLIVIAGACESHYEALIEAGANIASSPGRVFIHALDPLFAAEKIAYTPVDRYLQIDEILENNITGANGMGGIQSRGACRFIQKRGH